MDGNFRRQNVLSSCWAFVFHPRKSTRLVSLQSLALPLRSFQLQQGFLNRTRLIPTSNQILPVWWPFMAMTTIKRADFLLCCLILFFVLSISMLYALVYLLCLHNDIQMYRPIIQYFVYLVSLCLFSNFISNLKFNVSLTVPLNLFW